MNGKGAGIFGGEIALAAIGELVDQVARDGRTDPRPCEFWPGSAPCPATCGMAYARWVHPRRDQLIEFPRLLGQEDHLAREPPWIAVDILHRLAIHGDPVPAGERGPDEIGSAGWGDLLPGFMKPASMPSSAYMSISRTRSIGTCDGVGSGALIVIQFRGQESVSSPHGYRIRACVSHVLCVFAARTF